MIRFNVPLILMYIGLIISVWYFWKITPETEFVSDARLRKIMGKFHTSMNKPLKWGCMEDDQVELDWREWEMLVCYHKRLMKELETLLNTEKTNMKKLCRLKRQLEMPEWEDFCIILDESVRIERRKMIANVEFTLAMIEDLRETDRITTRPAPATIPA